MRVFDEGLMPYLQVVNAEPQLNARWRQWASASITVGILVALLLLAILLKTWRFLPHGLLQ